MITNIDILRHLKEKMTGDDGGASSHWRHYHQLFDIDEQLNVNTTGMLGFGDGKKPYSMLTRPIHYLLQRKFRKMIPDNATFRQIYEIAKNNTLEATSSDLLNIFVADLAFNIASMQEMDMEYIEKYFTEMRKIAKKMDIHFYCCNREQKYLPDGTSIVLDAYPWASDDTVYFSEMCPWHQEFYRITPPFYFNYDGPVRHSFTKLSKSI